MCIRDRYKRGWLEEATKNYRTACQLDPNNPEYQAAFRQVSNPRTGGYRAPRSNAGGCSACDICTGLMCADCFCDCCGADGTPCC